MVKEQKPIKILNTCNSLVDENELIKAILWYTDKPVISIKRVFIHHFYPTVSIYHQKIQIHRLLMMYWLKTKKLIGYVHHKDENKFNALKENLELIDCSFHQSFHNKGRKQTELHIKKRTNSTTLTRYGHIVYQDIHDQKAEVE